MGQCFNALRSRWRRNSWLGGLGFALGLPCLLAGCGGKATLAPKEVPTIAWATPAAITCGTTLSATQLNAAASVPGAFAYSPSVGALLNAGPQTISVTFTPADSADYATATASVTIQVNQGTPIITWATPVAISYGTPLGAAQLDATSGNAAGSFAYVPPSGTVLPAGSQTLTATFTPTDPADFTMASASVTIQVNKSTPAIAWAAPAAIPYGTALGPAQLDASSGGVAGTFVYSPGAGTALTAGSHTLTVTFNPTDSADLNPATASVTIQVSQATPALTWASPAPIVYGTALGAAQLDATASVAGTFAYSPTAGALLGAGPHTLSVTFTPADTVDYAMATANTTQTVEQATPVLSWPTPAPISYGTLLGATQLDATASVPGNFQYLPAAGAILPAGAQTLSATFTPADSVDYAVASTSVVLNVSQATPIINWTPAGTIAVGMTLTSAQLDATANVGGTFVYSPAAVSTVDSPGPLSLSVIFTPTDQADYAIVEAGATLMVLPFGVVTWGDSLTIGDQGHIDQGAYPTELAELISLPVVNEAVNANTATQIGVREGGIPTYATVAGGSIPAADGVIVTFPDGYEPVTARGPAIGVGGVILGVHGLVTFDLASSVYTFTRTAPGSAVNAPGSPQFVVDTPYAPWIPVFWEGRNDIADVSRTVSDIAAQVAVVPAGQTFVVLADINGNDPNEWIGGPDYAYIIDLNNQLANIYGPHYLDIRQLLISSYDPAQANDVADFNHDDLPTSLRAIYTTATLLDSIGPNDTVLTVRDTAVGLQIGAILTIDTGANAENVYIAALSGDTATVERNRGGPNIAHAAGAPLTESDSFHLNAKGYQIVANAVAQFLSSYAGQAKK